MYGVLKSPKNLYGIWHRFVTIHVCRLCVCVRACMHECVAISKTSVYSLCSSRHLLHADLYCTSLLQLFLTNYSYNGAPKKLGLKLPLFITKFIQGTSMNSQDFFKRWKQLGNEPSQEMQKIFPGKFPSNPASVKESVSIYKCACLYPVHGCVYCRCA